MKLRIDFEDLMDQYFLSKYGTTVFWVKEDLEYSDTFGAPFIVLEDLRFQTKEDEVNILSELGEHDGL